MKKNAGDLKMSLKQARKLYVLERLCEYRISNREAASNLNLSVRQTQRVKSRFSKPDLDGGISLVPLLTLLLGLPVKTAVATSLVAVVTTSLSASSSCIRKGLTNIRPGLFLETATTAGAVAVGIPAAFLSKKVPAVVFAIIAFYRAGILLS